MLAKPNSLNTANAVGPFIFVDLAAYKTIGGHQTLKNYMREDVEMARRFWQAGFKTQLGIGYELVDLKPSEGFTDLWESVSKLLFLVAGKSWLRIAFALTFEVFYGLVPLLIFLLAVSRSKKGQTVSSVARVFNLLSVLMLVVYTVETNRAFKIPQHFVPLYPASIVLTALIALNSAIRTGLLKKNYLEKPGCSQISRLAI